MTRSLARAFAFVLPPAFALAAQGGAALTSVQTAGQSASPIAGEAGGPASGDVVAANSRNASVSWFHGETGAFGGVLVAPGTGGLSAATGVVFGPDGDLYVGSTATHQILRYDGVTGEFLGAFTEAGVVQRPFSLTFDEDGSLLVSGGHSVLRLGPDGVALDTVVAAPDIDPPIGLRVVPSDSRSSRTAAFWRRTLVPAGSSASTPQRVPSRCSPRRDCRGPRIWPSSPDPHASPAPSPQGPGGTHFRGAITPP